MLDEPQRMQSDHDLLIQVNTNVTSMRDEMRQNNQSMTTQLLDHETRLRTLERYTSNSTGSSVMVKWLIGILIAIAGLVEPLLLVYLTRK